MSSKGTKSSGRTLVVEIGSDQVKLVEARPARGGGELSKIYVRRFERLDSTVVRDLAADFKKLRVGNGPVIGCLPRQALNVRILEVPSTDSDEIADMIELQIGKQTPYPRDEIVAAHRTLGAGREGYTRILLILVQKSLMNQRFRLLEEAGLEVTGMSVSSEGIINWCRLFEKPDKSGQATALLDIDASCSELAVMSGGYLVFTKSILVGASQLREDSVKWREKLFQEVTQALEAYDSDRHGGGTPARMIVTGAGADAEDLQETLAKRSGIAAEGAKSLRSTTKGRGLPNLDEGDYADASLTAVVGMALAPKKLEFNLVPEPVEMRRNLVAKARGLTRTGILLMLAASLASVISADALQKRVKYVSELRGEYVTAESDAREVRRKRAMAKRVVAIFDNTRAPVAVLKEMNMLTPRYVWWNQLTIEEMGRRVVLKGFATSIGYVNQLRESLRSSKIMPPRENAIDPGTLDPRTRDVKFHIVWETPDEEEEE